VEDERLFQGNRSWLRGSFVLTCLRTYLGRRRFRSGFRIQTIIFFGPTDIMIVLEKLEH